MTIHIRSYITFTTIVLFSMFMSGCAAKRGKVTEKSNRTDPARYFADTLSTRSMRQVEDLPPLRLPNPAFFVPPIEIKPEPYEFTKKVPQKPVETLPLLSEKLIEGYRIQLYSGREQALARKVKTEVESRFQHSVYLVYEAPQYKVRIGDFIERGDAGVLLRELRKAGYRDAWIVRSLVKTKL